MAGLTLDEVIPRLYARLQATPAGSDWDGVRQMLELTAIDAEEGVDALRGVAMAVAAAGDPETIGVGLLVMLLAGYEVGCSTAGGGV